MISGHGEDLRALSNYRLKIATAETIQQKIALENDIHKNLKIILEKYSKDPKCIDNPKFEDAKNQMMSINKRILSFVNQYNLAVTNYNVLVEDFPTNFFASFKGHKPLKSLIFSDH
jgi:hypothetical protein